MPTYEFACPSGHSFDKFYRSMNGVPSVLPCPECGAEATRKVSGGAGLVFKGSGFYITDYGKDGKKGQRAPDREAANRAASGDGPKDGGSGAGGPETGGRGGAKESGSDAAGGSGGSAPAPSASKDARRAGGEKAAGPASPKAPDSSK